MNKSQPAVMAATIAVSAAVSAVVSGVILLSVLNPRSGQNALDSSISSVVPSTMRASLPEGDVSDVVAQAQPSVVAVTTFASSTQLTRGLLNQLPEPNLQELRDGYRVMSAGSGFFVSPEGLLVTNKHVVDVDPVPADARKVEVTLHDGRVLAAKVVALDPVLDFAFLKVEGGPFPVLAFTDSDRIRAGQTVIAIGNALSEFPNTVTKGVVSGLNRRVWAGGAQGEEVIEEAIQTDAAINPGNSGGPLIDVFGRVVGMNTAVAQDGQSLAFSLPSNTLLRSLESVKQYGRVVRPYLGIRYVIRDEGGAEVSAGPGLSEPGIAPGSPADLAGVLEQDIIKAIDGIPIDKDHSPSTLIGRKRVGDQIRLTIERQGEIMELETTLIEYKT